MSEALEAIRELHIQARRGLEISQGTLRRADEAIHALAKLEADLRAANQRCQDLQVLVDCLDQDRTRLDFLEVEIGKSLTGLSLDKIPSIDGEPSGYRLMTYHKVDDPKSSLRTLIDARMPVKP